MSSLRSGWRPRTACVRRAGPRGNGNCFNAEGAEVGAQSAQRKSKATAQGKCLLSDVLGWVVRGLRLRAWTADGGVCDAGQAGAQPFDSAPPDLRMNRAGARFTSSAPTVAAPRTWCRRSARQASLVEMLLVGGRGKPRTWLALVGGHGGATKAAASRRTPRYAALGILGTAKCSGTLVRGERLERAALSDYCKGSARTCDAPRQH